MRNNKKGFTLIELLAVIVIMGILMIIAIPMMTKYIENSRKDTYVSTAKAYINAARYGLLNDEFTCGMPDTSGKTVKIPLSIVDIDTGGDKSPFNGTINKTTSYVIAKHNGTKVEFSIAIIDDKTNGTKGDVTEAALKRSDIYKGTATAGTTTGTACAKSTT